MSTWKPTMEQRIVECTRGEYCEFIGIHEVIIPLRKLQQKWEEYVEGHPASLCTLEEKLVGKLKSGKTEWRDVPVVKEGE